MPDRDLLLGNDSVPALPSPWNPITWLAVGDGPAGTGSRCTGVSRARGTHLAVPSMMTAKADGLKAASLPPSTGLSGADAARHAILATNATNVRFLPVPSAPPQRADVQGSVADFCN